MRGGTCTFQAPTEAQGLAARWCSPSLAPLKERQGAPDNPHGERRIPDRDPVTGEEEVMGRRYERSIAERMAERMVGRHRRLSAGYGFGWDEVSRLSRDHGPASLLTLRPYYGKKAHQVGVYWF